MGKLLKSRAFSVLLLAAATAGVLLAGKTAPAGPPALDRLPGMGREAAETALLGRERRELLDAWGEPDGMLSGFFGDVYHLKNGERVVVYYDVRPMNEGTADSRTVPVEHILFTEG